MIAQFLSSENNLINHDMVYVKSILWTREMWNLPIPESMTKCNCGSGVLQRKVIEDIDSNKTEIVEVDTLLSGRVKTFENCDMNWKTVTHSRRSSRRKSNSSVNDSCNKSRKGRSIKLSVGESKVVVHESVEEKKKNNRLFRCLTCMTEHPNVLAFNEHCGSVQHKDASNSSEKLSRDVEALKRDIVQILKQDLDRDLKVVQTLEHFKTSTMSEVESKLRDVDDKVLCLDRHLDNLGSCRIEDKKKILLNMESIDDAKAEISCLKEKIDGLSVRLDDDYNKCVCRLARSCAIEFHKKLSQKESECLLCAFLLLLCVAFFVYYWN